MTAEYYEVYERLETSLAQIMDIAQGSSEKILTRPNTCLRNASILKQVADKSNISYPNSPVEEGGG